MSRDFNWDDLSHNQRALVLRMRRLGFGSIRGLGVRRGDPSFGPNTRVEREVKLGRDKEPLAAPQCPSYTPKKAIQQLFEELARIGDGVVDIDVRHGLPTHLYTTEPGID